VWSRRAIDGRDFGWYPRGLVAARKTQLISFVGSAGGVWAACLQLHKTFGKNPVRNSIAYGWRVAVRTTLLQIGATLVVASALSIFDVRIGLATLAGGAIIAIGNWVFAMRLFGRGVAPARSALRSAYMAEVLKWFWLCLALYLAIAVFRLPFAGLIAGVLAAQFSFWIALIAIR
jgi:F0F1-type ATP synthase assembly protein I